MNDNLESRIWKAAKVEFYEDSRGKWGFHKVYQLVRNSVGECVYELDEIGKEIKAIKQKEASFEENLGDLVKKIQYYDNLTSAFCFLAAPATLFYLEGFSKTAFAFGSAFLIGSLTSAIKYANNHSKGKKLFDNYVAFRKENSYVLNNNFCLALSTKWGDEK